MTARLSQRGRARGALLAAALFFVPVPDAFAATKHAVIVGVSDYPRLPERMWLAGPRNDAALVRDFLITDPQAGFPRGNITVLADGVDGAERPTLAAIRRALTSVAAKAVSGDFVYLHFSGHGTQAPAAKPETELDGLDELFLPGDIGPWNDKVGVVENALVDDEIGTLIDAIRAKGAFVWAVFDSCHSGTVTRAAPADTTLKMRKLAASDLGIPEVKAPTTRSVGPSADRPRQSALAETKRAAQPTGGFVAFYAAQTTETTPEMRLPAGVVGRKPYGLFTFTLFETLAAHPGLSYRQLGQAILQHYAATNMPSPTPLFEGDLGEGVFGARPTSEIAQWPLGNADGILSFAGGRLHGLDEGSVLMVLPSPTANKDAVLGYVSVKSIDTLTSTAVPVARAGKKALAAADIPHSAYVRLAEKPLDFSLRVARPAFDGVPAEAKARVEAVLKSVVPEEGSGLRLAWAAPGEAADIRLAYLRPETAKAAGLAGTADQLWLLPPTGEIVAAGNGKSPSVRLDDKSSADAAAALLDNLTRIARATNLLKLGGEAGTGVPDVSIALRTRHKGEKNLRDLEPSAVPVMVPGDEVHIVAENTGMKPVDVNVLYVGSDYSISHMFNGRVQPGDKLQKGLLRITDGSFGSERVVLVVSPAKPQTEVQDLRFLAQKAIPRTRGDEAKGLVGLLRSAGFGTTTRAAVSLADEEPESGGAVVQFAIETKAN